MEISQIKKASLFTAIKTPYSKNGNIDLDAFDKLVQRQIEAKVDGLILCGTTGEGHLMNWDEHIRLISHAVDHFKNEIILIGNTGSNNTREAIMGTEKGFAMGMHASLQINPYYGKTNSEGMLAHFERLMNIGPSMIYNVPSRTNQDITPEIVKSLSSHTNFLGMKECVGPNRIKNYVAENIPCWSGNDEDCFVSRHKHRSNGVVSVTSNLIPRTYRTLMDKKEDDLFQKVIPLIETLFAEPNPICINTSLAMTGLCLPVFRLPYLPANISIQKKIIEVAKFIEELDPIPIKIMDINEFTIY